MSTAAAPGEQALPLVRKLIALDAGHYDRIRRAVARIFEITHGEPWKRRLDAEARRETDRFEPGNTGVMMGYDFHVTPEGPRLIEINTNAGGALVNGLHTLRLADPERLSCLCADLLPVERVEARIVETFREELRAARGAGARLGSVFVVDEEPEGQFLHPEFLLFRDLFRRHGIRADIAATGALRRAAAGGVGLGGAPADLVYLRDTDFALEAERSRILREAYLQREVVVSPSPREHFLVADKWRLVLLSSEDVLRELGVAEEDRALLAAVVPRTRPLAELPGEEAWRRRRELVFKPAAGFGSRAVYRGDKLTRRKLEELLRDPTYLVQERIDPAEVEVETEAGRERMKFDVRAYAYRGEVLLLGARAWRGQVLNLRTPGGGFSAICALRAQVGGP